MFTYNIITDLYWWGWNGSFHLSHTLLGIDLAQGEMNQIGIIASLL